MDETDPDFLTRSPSLRTRVFRQVERWRSGAGRHATRYVSILMAVAVSVLAFVLLLGFSAFVYFPLGEDATGIGDPCTAGLNVIQGTIDLALLYVLLLVIFTSITRGSERRRLQRMRRRWERRIAALRAELGPESDLSAAEDRAEGIVRASSDEHRLRWAAQLLILISSFSAPALLFLLSRILAIYERNGGIYVQPTYDGFTLLLLFIHAAFHAAVLWRVAPAALRFRKEARELGQSAQQEWERLETRLRSGGGPEAEPAFTFQALQARRAANPLDRAND